MKPKFTSKDFLWLSLALFVPLIIYVIRSVSPNDYWWYIRLGGEIAQTHAVPTIESYSYTQAGDPKINPSWLSALLFFWLNELGGITLTVFFGALVIGVTYTLLWLMMREMKTAPLLIWVLIFFSILPGSMNWSMRPQLFTYPLFVWSLWVLWRWQHGKTRELWALPLIVLFWVNLHGSFILAFVLAGSAFVFGTGDKKRLFYALILMTVAVFVNPRGFGAWTFVLFSMKNPSIQMFATEWMPPINEGWQMNLFFAWTLFFMAAAGLSSRVLSTLEWVWILGFGWLALSGLRYGIWFLFILAPMSAWLLSKEEAPKMRAGLSSMNMLLGLLLLIFPLTLLPNIRDAWWMDASPALSDETPVSAVQWLDAHPDLPDPIWADLAFESYLIYALPERPVWIDTRLEVYPPEDWQRYKAINAAAWNWQSLLDEDEINILLLSNISQSELLKAVNTSDIWCEIYADEQAMIYARRGIGDFCE